MLRNSFFSDVKGAISQKQKLTIHFISKLDLWNLQVVTG